MAELTVNDVAVATYVVEPALDIRLAPRPYLHPVRTLGGVVVTDELCFDHPWHLGASLTMADVNGVNVWGGRTFVRDSGYVWLPDHGRVRHDGWLPSQDGGLASQDGGLASQDGGLASQDDALASQDDALASQDGGPASQDDALASQDDALASQDGGPASRDGALASAGGLAESLSWLDGDERTLLSERRQIAATSAPGGWELSFRYALTAPDTHQVVLGSPATHGRTGGAGYGGFFWRLPAGSAVAFTSDGGEPHGSEASWLAVTVDEAYTLIFEGLEGKDRWFVRAGEYNGVCAALAFATPLVIPASETITRHIRVRIADGPFRGEGIPTRRREP
jgi:hypothetical protein